MMIRLLTATLAVALGLAIMSVGCGGHGGGDSTYAFSVARVKALDVALTEYVGDWDDSYPPGVTWMDGLVPYVHDASDFHSPGVALPGYGYAFNVDLAGKSVSVVTSPETTITIFDSTNLNRNAVAPTTTVPVPPRYGGYNTIGYADGHVKDELGLHPSLEVLYGESVTRIQSVNTAALIYAGDYDDCLPLAANWVDGTWPYSRSDSIYRSPIVERHDPTQYGYAYNIALAGVLDSAVDRGTTVSFFDSTILARNAASTTSTLPSPPRYVGVNTIVYLDGHAQAPFGREPTVEQLYGESQTRMKQLSVALIEYANDNDNRLPLANKWMDETLPYCYDSEVYRSPQVERSHPDLFGYAFNFDLSGLNIAEIADPATTISLFDSTVLTWNATASLSTMPNPPRYRDKNTIGYADGHVP